ncbi:hypothetical protein EDC90_100312 [Martelella mediterranea]|uniref:Uncharacterized protein n=1 Tax=Martelella mediterranea TaxID=293089 RepID=A0A4R3NX34_9HYPH|nr:hypothetical protein EDC90_100312 [Martelella mediterranea]
MDHRLAAGIRRGDRLFVAGRHVGGLKADGRARAGKEPEQEDESNGKCAKPAEHGLFESSGTYDGRPIWHISRRSELIRIILLSL